MESGASAGGSDAACGGGAGAGSGGDGATGGGGGTCSLLNGECVGNGGCTAMTGARYDEGDDCLLPGVVVACLPGYPTCITEAGDVARAPDGTCHLTFYCPEATAQGWHYVMSQTDPACDRAAVLGAPKCTR
jgi:hypothetical protein